MAEQGAPSIETLASGAIAAGCLQAVMSMVHPELAKFVSFQRERVARSDAQRPAMTTARHSRRSKAEETENLSLEQQTDLSFQLKYLRRHWHSHLRYYGLDPELPGVVQRALLYRNKVSHQSQMTLAQYEDAIATFESLADIIECNALVRQQIRDLVTKLLSFSPLNKTQETQIEPKEVEIQAKETKREEPMPPTASLDQILQHNYLYDGEEDEDPLWVDLKLIGNDYFKEGNYTEAIEAYSQGLDVAPNEAVLFGNRAMCYLRLKDFECAREDAEDALDADNYENVKYYRLLSEALMGLEDYDEAKEACDDGLVFDPQDATLLKRKRTVEMMIAKEKAADEKEKKRREKEERAKVEAANAVAKAEELPKPKSKSNKKKNKLKPKAPEMELAPMINYQDVPQKWIEVHTRGSRRLEMYEQGMEGLVVAAKALLQVTDSIGMPGRSKLPLGQLVQNGMAHLRQSGEAGVAEAWFRLGVLYSSSVRKGMPLTADPHKMLECFNKAASLRPFIKPPGNRVFPHQGVAEAENELGVCYRDGKPAPIVEVDLKKAFQFFLRSAEHDFPLGQYNVAVAYATGSGAPCDPFAARMWTSRAAQHGLPEAQQYLAQLFEKGFGGKRDEKQAREWSLTAMQNRLTDLTISRGFADVGVHAVKGGQITEKFASNPAASQRGKEVFQELYDMYLDQEKNGKAAFDLGVDSDGEEIKITKVSSYTRSATSSSDQMGWIGIYRSPSAVIDAEIQARAKAGGLTACNYLASEKLLQSAGLLFTTGDIKGALRDLKKADLTWERPKGAFTTVTSTADLLPTVLKEASVSLQINPRDVDAAYVVGRWEIMSDQDIIQHWKRCAKMHPNEACFHFYLGTAYMTLQRYNDAMDAMDAALAIEKKPDWLYWSAAPMIAMGMIDSAMSVYKEYVDSNPPDERFIPDAYYSIGALYFKKYDNAMATVYHELGQMAESVAIRFPAFHPHVLHDIPKETLRSGMKKNGYMDPSVIASVTAQNMVECGYCKANIKPTQLLVHRLSKCPRRTVVCPDCDERMVFDCLQPHRQSLHPGSSKSKKKKSKKKKASYPTETKENAPEPAQTNGSLQELTSPKFHFAGAILDITKGKNNSTVFSLKTVIGQRWTLRVLPSSSSCGVTDAFDAAKAIAEAEVNNSMLVFWCSSPPLEMIDRKALTVPIEGEVYGQDVAIYILKCSSQVLGVEVCQLRHNKYMENGSLCSGCGIPPFTDEGLSACSACKAVKYCTRECQKLHWKRIHRHMCKNTQLLEFCSTLTEDVTPDERRGIKVDVPIGKKGKEGKKETATANISYEDVVYVDSMLEILEDIMETAKTKGNGPEVAEYYMLPPRDPRHPGTIEGSVRIFSQAKEFVAEFCVGYLTSTPSLLQQQELQYFFQIPPHNPLKLTCGASQVFLGKCKALSDDGGSRGYRLALEMPLNTYALPDVAEVLVYLLSTTNKYLK